MGKFLEVKFGLPLFMKPGNVGRGADRTAEELFQLASALKGLLAEEQHTPVEVAGLTATPNAFNAILSDMPTVEPSITTPPTVDCNEDSESTAEFFEPKPRMRSNANAFVDGSTASIRQELRMQQVQRQNGEGIRSDIILDGGIPLYRDAARVNEQTIKQDVVVQVTPMQVNQSPARNGYQHYPIERQLQLLRTEIDAYPKTGKLPDISLYSGEVVTILDEFMKSKTSVPAPNPANKANYTVYSAPTPLRIGNNTVHVETSSAPTAPFPVSGVENEFARQPEKSRRKIGGVVLRLFVGGVVLVAAGYTAYTTSHDWAESAAKETCEANWAVCVGKGLVDARIPNIPDIPSIQNLISSPEPAMSASVVEENKVPEEKR